MAIASRRGIQLPPEPVAKMTGGKVTLLVSFALLFDALKFMCTQLWFFGPALIALAGSVAVGGGWFGAAVGTIIGAGAAATVGAAIEAVGIILALVVGLVGWIILFTLMIAMGIQPFGEKHFITTLFGFLVSEIPFIDAVPSFTISMWRIVQGERKADREARKKWETENAALIKRRQREALLAQKQLAALQAGEEQAAQEEADAAQAEADAAAAMDDNEEEDAVIPFDQPKRQPLVSPPSL